MTEAKACSTCREVKPLEEFFKDRTKKDGRGSTCKKCSKAYNKAYFLANKPVQLAKAKVYRDAHPEQTKAVTKAWYRLNKTRNKNRILLKTYGVTPEQMTEMLTEQRGRCAICKNELVTPCVDHDHNCCSGKSSCGKCIRGLLCGKCNAGIGLLGDSQVNLLSAARYLGAKRTSQE